LSNSSHSQAVNPFPAPPIREGVAAAIATHELREVEIAWADHFGHTLGKRLPATGFAERAGDERFGFCDATLSWDATAGVHIGGRLTDWHTGFPDLYAVPDEETFRPLPWRAGTGQFIGDVETHDGQPVLTAPRTVLRRVVAHLAELGYEARVGVEIECFLLDLGDLPLGGSVHCYSLEKLNELDPALGALVTGLDGYVPVEGVTGEYGPGQIEVNLRYGDPLTAADDGFRLKYASRVLAREAGIGVTFMAKPFEGLSGNSMHLHLSLLRDGRPAFAPEDGAENAVGRSAIASLVQHLPAITVFGAPNVNSYKRFEAESYAPITAAWGGDNRTAAVRSLVEGPNGTRVELRTPGADANPYWAIAALLAAVAVGLEGGGSEPPSKGEGNLYGVGAPLPRTPVEAVALARADKEIVDVLGEDAVYDYTLLVEREWEASLKAITDWERTRYLDLA
jgi:glutamine synthetase